VAAVPREALPGLVAAADAPPAIAELASRAAGSVTGTIDTAGGRSSRPAAGLPGDARSGFEGSEKAGSALGGVVVASTGGAGRAGSGTAAGGSTPAV
jgi:hypothetical protein